MRIIQAARRRARFVWEGVRVHVTELLNDAGQSMPEWNVDFYGLGMSGHPNGDWRGSAAWLPESQEVEARTIKPLPDAARASLTAAIKAAEFIATNEPFTIEESGDRCECCGQLKPGVRP
jgi:hypothetical protein